MSLPVWLWEEAQADYDAAYDWYRERNERLADRFEAAVGQAICDIGDHFDRWPEILPGLRSMRLLEWPYRLIYMPLDSSIGVVAIVHTARDSQAWRTRIEP